MKTLHLRNWAKWQSYRRDRGQPPWIKVHRTLLRDVNWVSLSDSQRGQLVSLWMLAADKDGEIPASPSILQKICFMESEPDLQLFINHGFIEPNANTTPTRRHDDANTTQQRRIEESKSRGDKPSTAPSVPPEFDQFKSMYPKRSGTQPWGRALKAIKARLKKNSTWQDILDGAKRYAEYCEATHKIGTEYVMQAATFCGPELHFLESWKPPPKKSEVQVDKNVDAGLDFLESVSGS